MDATGLGPSSRENRGQWIRLRTLTLLRWLAVFGQLVAITVADRYLDITLPLGLCYAVVGASVLSNLLAAVLFPENKRLSEGETMLTLLFDIAQLGVLLYLTGGLTNPFALLMLGPVTISASALPMRATLFLGGVAVVLISLLAVTYEPLRFADGSVLAIDPLFSFGFWLAIVTGIVFQAFYAGRVTREIDTMSDALLAAQMALAREPKLTDLGGVVAAAAHELGTPLATIKLVSSELATELAHHPDLREDAELIRSQADRCRDILRAMGPAGKQDTQMRHAPLEAVLREAAEPHVNRGRNIAFVFNPAPGADQRQPVIQRRPEIVHGLRNLIQNAVDFAGSQVWVIADWDDAQLRLRLADDGPGFDPQLIARIGEPFLRRRRGATGGSERPGYDGMGLGLFIAKTLLERTGARLGFANTARDTPGLPPQARTGGALVELAWPRDRIEADPAAPAGPNVPTH